MFPYATVESSVSPGAGPGPQSLTQVVSLNVLWGLRPVGRLHPPDLHTFSKCSSVCNGIYLRLLY